METGGVLTCLLVLFVIDVRGSLITTQLDLCGPITELGLDQYDESAATITLASNEYTSTCTLKVRAPETHVILVNIIEAEYLGDSLTRSKPGSCHLNVYQENNSEPVWTGDPCSDEPLTDIDLLNPEMTLEWSPPADSSQIRGKKLLVTAVGRGDACKDSLQHTCMSIGLEPLFCVSKYLICDGNHNCPKGATKSDEEDKMCKITFLMLYKQIKHSNSDMHDKVLNFIMSKSTKAPITGLDWREWTRIQRIESMETTTLPTTTEGTHTSNIESLSTALSHYGPWGYILLGMLICGTVLMFCGVWECFRKPKPAAEAVPSSPTTVLIINQQEENGPPRYDDIDPPSYATLFPNVKANEPIAATDPATSQVSANPSEEAGTTETAANQSSNQVAIESTTIEGASDNNFNDAQTNFATTSRHGDLNTVSEV